MTSILIKNSWIVLHSRKITRGNLYIEDNLISDINSKNMEADFVIEGKNLVVCPGFVNSHTHIAMSIMRGFLDDMEFEEFLKKTSKIDSRMGERDIYLGAKLGIIEMVRSGITLFFDMYYSENIVAEVAKELGIRAALGWAVVDEDKTTQKGNPLKNAEKFIKEYRDEDRIYPMVAPHGVYSCNDETLLASKEIADKYNVPVHMHTAESREEVYGHYKRKRNRIIEYLDNLGILSPKFMAVHAVWLTMREVRILKEKGVTVVHCPTSNMKLGIGGYSPIPEMMEYGINIAIGTDSAATNNSLDIFREMRMAALVHKNSRWDPSLLKAEEVFKMATENPYRFLSLKGGRIEEGYLADICIIDGNDLSMLPLSKSNIINNIVYSATAQSVKYTIVDGKILQWKKHLDDILNNIGDSEVFRWLSGMKNSEN